MSIDLYRHFSARRSQIKAQIVDLLSDYPINALDVRVENFLGQLAVDLETKALEQLKGKL